MSAKKEKESKFYRDHQQALQKVYKRDGCVQASRLLQEASDPDSPAHEHYEWDDRIAGPLYRLEQARTVCRTVHIEIVKGQKEFLVNVPIIQRTNETSEGFYQIARLVVQVQSEYDRAIGLILGNMEGAVTNLDSLITKASKPNPKLQGVLKAIRRARSQLEAVRHDAA